MMLKECKNGFFAIKEISRTFQHKLKGKVGNNFIFSEISNELGFHVTEEITEIPKSKVAIENCNIVQRFVFSALLWNISLIFKAR